MEVFMRNLPPDIVTEDTLKANLKPLISKLGIDMFGCQKKTKATTGSIIFIKKGHGEKFLEKYGAELQKTADGKVVRGKKGKPREKSRLSLFNNSIYCVPGRKTPKALEIDIKRISYKTEKEKEQREWEAKNADRNQGSSVVFELLDLACGYIAFPDGACHFRQDMSWPQRQARTYGQQEKPPIAKFAKSSVILQLMSGMRVEISFNGIIELVVGDKDCSLTFILTETPKFYATGAEALAEALANLDIADHPKTPKGQESLKLRTTSLGGRHETMVGACLVYRIQVHSSEFTAKLRRLLARPFLSELINTDAYIPLLPLYQAPNFPPLDESMIAFNRRLVDEGAEGKVPFGVLFQLQVLAWNGYLLPNTVLKLLDMLKKREGTPEAISATSIKKHLGNIPFPIPDVDTSKLDPDTIMDRLDDIEKGRQSDASLDFDAMQENEHLIWIYKALVTPTHVLLLGPELEARNRVLRKFPDNTDYFVRIQFGDEDGDDVRYNPRVSNELVYNRFKKLLTQGVPIAGRQYAFFGFSHSSLRSHSAWFQSPFIHGGTLRAYFNIIPGLGDFKNIRVVAKCAARIGQAFSETPYAVNMKQNGIAHVSIPDIKSPDASRVFSDGVGTMSQEAMQAIWNSLPGNAGGATVYQIRFGGSKGVISLDARLSGRVICIRTESMQKFTSNDTDNLEICGMNNRPIRLVLNRQNIKILEDMGVPRDWFLALQSKELDRLRGVTKSVFNTAVFLTQQSIGDSIEFPKFLKRLERLGIDYRSNQLLCSIIESVVLQELRLLKHKARIPVPKGITLYGVIDETGFLEEGEVYVAFYSSDGLFQSPPEDNTRLLVTRSPALHPGDIQLAVNRVPPETHPLWQLSNCIVFNHKGDRDIPSMLSGGDLDGDMYHVIWDPEISFDTIGTHEPADYNPQPPLDIGRDVTREDMAHFLIDFMKTDQLGLISTRHMILADQEEEGTVHQNCKILAELASTAVDFSKTGIPADVNRMREIKYNMARPDFLAPAPPVEFVDLATVKFENEAPIPENDEDEDTGAQHKYYKSSKILGVLFRAVKEERIWHDSVRIDMKRDRTTLWDQLRQKVDAAARYYQLGWVHMRPKARELRTMYEEAVWNAMFDNAEHPHKPLSEIELFVGQVFNKRGAQTRRQRDSSEKLRSTFDRISGGIWRMIRERPRLAGDTDSVAGSVASSSVRTGPTMAQSREDKDALELALACFHVAMDDTGFDVGYRYSQQQQVESFKVLAANVFLKELEMYQKAEDMRRGEYISGGYVGVSSGWRRGGLRSGRRDVVGMVDMSRASSRTAPSFTSSLNSSLRLVPPQVDLGK